MAAGRRRRGRLARWVRRWLASPRVQAIAGAYLVEAAHPGQGAGMAVGYWLQAGEQVVLPTASTNGDGLVAE